MKKGFLVNFWDGKANYYPAIFMYIKNDREAVVRPLQSGSAMCRTLNKGSISCTYYIDKETGRAYQ